LHRPNAPPGNAVRGLEVISLLKNVTASTDKSGLGLRQLLASLSVISGQIRIFPLQSLQCFCLKREDEISDALTVSLTQRSQQSSQHQDCYSLLSWTHDLLNHFWQTIYSHLHSETLHVRCIPQTSDAPVFPRRLYEHHRTTNMEEQYSIFPD
jgi:hypothetical protein